MGFLHVVHALAEVGVDMTVMSFPPDADFADAELRGTAHGVLGTVNRVGDLV